jgi:hypothetical protein
MFLFQTGFARTLYFFSRFARTLPGSFRTTDSSALSRKLGLMLFVTVVHEMRSATTRGNFAAAAAVVAYARASSARQFLIKPSCLLPPHGIKSGTVYMRTTCVFNLRKKKRVDEERCS